MKDTQGEPRILPDNVSEIAKAILKDVVGLSFNSDTSRITMTPESFIGCIRSAMNRTPAIADGDMNPHCAKTKPEIIAKTLKLWRDTNGDYPYSFKLGEG